MAKQPVTTLSGGKKTFGKIGVKTTARPGTGKRAQTHSTEAANTSGLRNNNGGSQGGGGGGGSGGAVSTLAGLPQTPLLKDLIAKGIITEGMPQEQALAILAISQVQSQGPIDLKALKDMITADYANTTGDIFKPATDWMQQLYGANTPGAGDPNAALFANDPIFGEYAGGLQQMQETANTNQATDQAWLDKQQQAMTDYYNGLIAAVSSGQLGGDTGGGSGGGGGGRRHYGGGGSGGGSGDSPFSEPDTTVTTKNGATVNMDHTLTAYNPGWYQAVLDQFGDNAFITDAVRQHSRPDDFTGYLSGEATRILADMDAADQTNVENEQWTQKSPEQFQIDLTRYLSEKGLLLGDDPTTPEAEFQYEAAPGQGLPVLSDDAALDRDTFDPLYQQFLSGQSLGLNAGNQQEALEYASNYLTNLLDPNRVDPFAAKLASAGLAGRGTSAPPPGGGSGGSSGNDAGVGGGGMSPSGQNPYTTGVPGAYNVLSSANTGSISGGPATSVLSPESVMAGTYGPALNQTDQAANVSPYDSDTGRPLQELQAQLAQSQQGGSQPWNPSQMGGWHIPQSVKDYLQRRQTSAAATAAADDGNPDVMTTEEYNAAMGYPPTYNAAAPANISQGSGGGSMADAIAQLPPEIRQAAGEHAGGPPSITDINWALMQAGQQPLGTLPDGSVAGGTQPSGNFGSSRPMMPYESQLGMGGAMPANFKQMPTSDPIVPPPTNPGGALMGAAPSPWHKTSLPADQQEAYRQQMLASAPLTSGMGAWNLLNNSGSIQQAQAGGPHPDPFTPTDIVNYTQNNIWTTDENGQRILKPEAIAAFQNYSSKMGQYWQRGYNQTTGPNPTTPGQFYDSINIMPDEERATNEALMKAIHDAIAITDPMNPQLNMTAVKDNMNIGSDQSTVASSVVKAKDNPDVALQYTGMETPPLTPDESYLMDDTQQSGPQSTILGPDQTLGFRMPTLGAKDPYTIGGGIPQLLDVPPKMDQFIQQAAQNMTRKKTGGGTKSYKAPGSNIKKTYQTTGKKIGGNKLGGKQTYRKF